MFSNGGGRAPLRHSSSSQQFGGGGGSLLDRALAACGSCSLRGFVLGVGGVLVLANLALLLLLNGPGAAFEPEHRPSGGPVRGTDSHDSQLLAPVPRGAGGDGALASRSASLLKSHFDRAQAMGNGAKGAVGEVVDDAAARTAAQLAEFERLASERLRLLQQAEAAAKLLELSRREQGEQAAQQQKKQDPVPAAAHSGSAVVAATDETFDKDVLQATEQIVMVDFFAPWCGHCRNLAPEWQKAAETLRSRGSPIKLVTLDATRHKALAATYGVVAYPTIKVFHRGNPRPEVYDGARVATAIVDFAVGALDPALTPAREETAKLDQAAEEAAAKLAAIEQRRSLQQPQTQTTPPAAVPPALTPAQRTALWSTPASPLSPDRCDAQFANGFTPQFKFCTEAGALDGATLASSVSSLECSFNSVVGSAYCAARNLVLDLSLLRVAPGGEPIEAVRGRNEDAEFARYSPGALGLRCGDGGARPSRESLPHHLHDMVSSLAFHSPSASASNVAECAAWIEAPTLLLTRYEYANLYHSLGDFYNAYQMQWMAGLDDTGADDGSGGGGEKKKKTEVHVVFMDGHSAGALDEVWPRLFGPHVSFVMGLPAKYGSAPHNGRYCFRRAWLVSPAYKSALSVDMMGGGGGGGSTAKCAGHPALQDFVDTLVRRYDADSTDPATLFPPPGSARAQELAAEGRDNPGVDLFGRTILPPSLDLAVTPLVVLILRRDYLAHPRLQSLRASRKLTPAAEAGVSEVFARAGQWGAHAVAVDFAKLDVQQQLVLVRSATVLAGIHGAGLSYALFLRPGASVLELVPPEYSARPHFRFFSQWAGRNYAVLAASADARGEGHNVDTGALERELGRVVRGAAGQSSAVVPPTPGWLISRGRGGVQSQALAAGPPTIVLAPGDPYTPGMLDEALPASALRPGATAPSELNPQPDLGTDLGPGNNNGHRLCVVVPFRDSRSPTSQGANRTANLMEMIPHMIRHLSWHGGPQPPAGPGMKLAVDFEILVVEQTEGHVFNKGALFNVGYLHARAARCDYMVLHDVDQLPASSENRYTHPAAGQAPIHLCSASSQYGYAMAYGTMVGGALLLSMAQYEAVNGYSNFYWGWGQEDDDFYYRLVSKHGQVVRLSSEQGRYEALSHPRVRDLDVTPVFSKGTQHLTDTRMGAFDIRTDGISNLRYKLRAVERWPEWPRGVRKIVAELDFENMPLDLNGRTQ